LAAGATVMVTVGVWAFPGTEEQMTTIAVAPAAVARRGTDGAALDGSVLAAGRKRFPFS